MNLTTSYPVGTVAMVRVRSKVPNPMLPRWEHVYLGLKTVWGWTITDRSERGGGMSAEVKDDWYRSEWVVTDVVPLEVTADAYELGSLGLARPPGPVQFRPAQPQPTLQGAPA